MRFEMFRDLRPIKFISFSIGASLVGVRNVVPPARIIYNIAPCVAIVLTVFIEMNRLVLYLLVVIVSVQRRNKIAELSLSSTIARSPSYNVGNFVHFRSLTCRDSVV